MPFSRDRGFTPPTQARKIALAMIAALLLLVGLQLHRDHAAAIEQGSRLTDAVVNAMEQQLNGSIRALHSLLEEAADGAESGHWNDPDFVEMLQTRLREFPEAKFISRIDKDGWLRSNTIPYTGLPAGGIDVSDRGYFRRQKDAGPKSDMWVGDPVVGRLTHERTIHMSHPVFSSKGEFDGVVMVAVSPDGYGDFLRSIMLEPAGAASILRLDGSFLARAPDLESKFGMNIAGSELFTVAIPKSPKGVLRLVAKADGNDKLLAYRVIPDYDLVVTAGLSMSTALKGWWDMVLLEGVTVLLFVSALFYWAWQADLRAGRSAQAQGLLEEVVSERTAQLEHSSRLAEDRARRLAVVNEELGRLAQVTAHHLQEPLRPIVSYSQMIRRRLADNEDEELNDWLGFVEHAGLRLKALLRDFQRYAGVLALEPSAEVTDADEALTLALARIRPLITESGAEISRTPLPWVEADRQSLAGVFLQLIDNAIRHRHPDRRPKIIVDVVELGKFWSFSVADNAKGIDPNLTAKAFDAFERLGETGDDSTGLGLAICRAVVQSHGGRIWIEPLPEGSAFHFTLPKGRPPEPPVSPARQSGF